MKGLPGRLLLTVVAVAVAFIAACATMQGRWEAATSADTINAYDDFLKVYPEGDFADQARVRRNELREERDWKDAEAKNTVQAYEEFRNNHPQGKRRNDAYARLQMLAPPRVADLPVVSTERFLQRYQRGVFLDEAIVTDEKRSYEQAVTENTIAAYENFLKRYPAGRLAGDARRRREELSVGQSRSEAAGLAPVWGKIMYPRPGTNIRAKRSAASPLKGQLKAGQPVKVDFLQDGWYAVFPVTQKERNEKGALGYVSATLLMAQQGPDSAGAAAAAGKPAQGLPPKSGETERPTVEVKNIAFKAAGNGKELLLIEFDRFYTPTLSGIEGKEPRIILEIKETAPLREDWAAINTGGNLIRQIRGHRDGQTRAALIVLDMVPEKAYFVNPAFYRKENIYVLEISEQKESPLP